MSIILSDYPEDVQASLTAYGAADISGVRRAHTTFTGRVGPGAVLLQTRERREEALDVLLAPNATRSFGAGHRVVEEEPDAIRTCFERDLDRIKHSTAFRRLAGKCQVFVAPDDIHLRTRLTHSLEVAQVAVGIAQATGLNLALVEAGALAHDCGHGPIGHASEEAFTPFLPGGYDHAPYGADVMLSGLNLTTEVLDTVRQHSWKRPAPLTVEAEVVSFSDRLAYVCHDFDDATRAGIVSAEQLPAEVAQVLGRRQSEQIRTLIGALVTGITSTGVVGLPEPYASALDAFRKFNYERIYLRPASRSQAQRAIKMLRELVEFFADHPGKIGEVADSSRVMPLSGSLEAAEAAVYHVAQMTDKTVLDLSVTLLGWDKGSLPRGV